MRLQIHSSFLRAIGKTLIVLYAVNAVAGLANNRDGARGAANHDTQPANKGLETLDGQK